MDQDRRKQLGAYYTPDPVVHSLVNWAVSTATDRMLDPSCGDGRFLVIHPNSVGVEGDPLAAAAVHARAPGSLMHQGDFFAWAAETHERFECAAGNPPFIRYQRFTGAVREAALAVCLEQGARFNSLSSSWAPFLVATASLLKPGGRMAFVVPAEIGHAPYAVPLLEYLLGKFESVHVIAVREKLFPELSEDCWLLSCRGFGGRTNTIKITRLRHFEPSNCPPKADCTITVTSWRQWRHRIRPFLLSDEALSLYRSIAASPVARRLSDLARVGIGYVTGANNFFHLRPSEANRLGIADRFLCPAVRNGRDLVGETISRQTIDHWREKDNPNFLLRLQHGYTLPSPVCSYLESDVGRLARESYKCRNRNPWYVVPDVHVPDAFLSYMSGQTPSLVANSGGCVATNSVHVVRMKGKTSVASLQRRWADPLTKLSCEIEGHPLGGGMLKLEPREAGQVLLRACPTENRNDAAVIMDAIDSMRQWRHYGQGEK